MKQPGQKDMHVAVPEAGGHDQALAVDYGRTAWDFDSAISPIDDNADRCAEGLCRFRLVVQMGRDKSLHQPRPGRRHGCGQSLKMPEAREEVVPGRVACVKHTPYAQQPFRSGF